MQASGYFNTVSGQADSASNGFDWLFPSHEGKVRTDHLDSEGSTAPNGKRPLWLLSFQLEDFNELADSKRIRQERDATLTTTTTSAEDASPLSEEGQDEPTAVEEALEEGDAIQQPLFYDNQVESSELAVDAEGIYSEFISVFEAFVKSASESVTALAPSDVQKLEGVV
eukprot:gene25280-27371_t